MIGVLLSVLAIATLAVSVLLAPWLAQCIAARRGHDAPAVAAPPYAVLVPAHDEEEGIGATLSGILAQLRAGDRLLVVADNCTDTTADRAMALGAEVFVRHDRERRGKGYALAAGLSHLAAADAPALVIVVDADCRLAPSALEQLASAATTYGQPVQGDYQLVPTPGAGLGGRLSSFAFRVKNLVRPSGGLRLGCPMPLAGSGMAFPPGTLDDMDLATGSIVEDLVLSLALARRGRFVRFVPGAVITSVVAPSDRGRSIQRRRWIAGHFGAAAHFAPRLAGDAWRTRDLRPLLLALDVLVPPLTLLAALLAALAMGAVAIAVATGEPAALAGAVPALLFALVMTRVWWRFGRDLLSSREFLLLPARLAGRLPGLLRAPFRGGGGEWTRTER